MLVLFFNRFFWSSNTYKSILISTIIATPFSSINAIPFSYASNIESSINPEESEFQWVKRYSELCILSFQYAA